MDRVEQYRTLVEQTMNKYARYKRADENVEVQLVLDKEHDHYRLSNVGWIDQKRIRWDTLHIDIKNGKIWIQHDGTERGIANDLVELGVPKQDIVLAFQAPYKRKYTDFAEN